MKNSRDFPRLFSICCIIQPCGSIYTIQIQQGLCDNLQCIHVLLLSPFQFIFQLYGGEPRNTHFIQPYDQSGFIADLLVILIQFPDHVSAFTAGHHIPGSPCRHGNNFLIADGGFNAALFHKFLLTFSNVCSIIYMANAGISSPMPRLGHPDRPDALTTHFSQLS